MSHYALLDDDFPSHSSSNSLFAQLAPAAAVSDSLFVESAAAAAGAVNWFDFVPYASADPALAAAASAAVPAGAVNWFTCPMFTFGDGKLFVVNVPELSIVVVDYKAREAVCVSLSPADSPEKILFKTPKFFDPSVHVTVVEGGDVVVTAVEGESAQRISLRSDQPPLTDAESFFRPDSAANLDYLLPRVPLSQVTNLDLSKLVVSVAVRDEASEFLFFAWQVGVGFFLQGARAVTEIAMPQVLTTDFDTLALALSFLLPSAPLVEKVSVQLGISSKPGPLHQLSNVLKPLSASLKVVSLDFNSAKEVDRSQFFAPAKLQVTVGKYGAAQQEPVTDTPKPVQLCSALTDASAEAASPRVALRVSDSTLWRLGHGDGVRVAVLDSGIDAGHAGVRDSVVWCKSFVDGEHAWTDANGHGTFCASILCGPDGIAPGALLFIGKVIGADGVGTVDALVRGIEWAVDRGCAVISLSVGTNGPHVRLLAAVNRALEAGVHVICAAANEGARGSFNIAYPARYGHVVCVGGCDSSGKPPAFSARGREIDLLAPSVAVKGLFRGALEPQAKSGTSMAVPFVSAVVAVLVGHFRRSRPERPLSCAVMKSLLVQMCAHPGAHSEDDGYGMLGVENRFSLPAFIDALADDLCAVSDVVETTGRPAALNKQSGKDKAERQQKIEEERAKEQRKRLLADAAARARVAKDDHLKLRITTLTGVPVDRDDAPDVGVADPGEGVFDLGWLGTGWGVLGFHNFQRRVDGTHAEELVQAARTTFLDDLTNWQSACGRLPVLKVNRPDEAVHFGYAFAFVRLEHGNTKNWVALLLGAANGSAEDANHFDGDGSARGGEHTESLIIDRLLRVLAAAYHRGCLVVDVRLFFFLEKTPCGGDRGTDDHACVDNIRAFFGALWHQQLLPRDAKDDVRHLWDHVTVTFKK